MDLYIIRHGHRADKEPDYEGGGNPPLSEIGQQQAEHLASRVAALKPDAIYSSAMRRSIQTALPAAAQAAVPVRVWPMLCECNYWTWSHQNYLEAEGAIPPTNRAETGAANEFSAPSFYNLSEIPGLFPGTQLDQSLPWPDQWWNPLVDESIEPANARLQVATQALLARHKPTDTVVLIIHGGSGELILYQLLDIPLRHGNEIKKRRFRSRPTAVAHVNLKEDGIATLHCVNCVHHLPEALVTL